MYLEQIMRYIIPRIFLTMLLILLVVALTRCAIPPPDAGVPAENPLVESHVLKPNLSFSVDNIAFVGSAIVERQSRSVIRFMPPPETSLILISTCGRQKDFWNPNPKQVFTYDYRPMFDIENRGSCMLYMTAVTTKGEWYRGVIDFTNSGALKDLSLEVGCDGDWYKPTGNFFCPIAFGIPVYLKHTSKIVIGRDQTTTCPEPIYEGLPTNQWRIKTRAPKKNEAAPCIYVVYNEKKEKFRLTVYAYTSILKVYPPGK